mmetsp:Transcript_2351/g.6939  ORF Transcript_2351/g.6939 Transcript_2351/m.6939 type:complete len:301 (-) Transcript_2351:156-1058(-)
MPRAATSVAMRILTSPALKASRFRRRSSMDRMPARTQHAYAPSLPDSLRPRNAPPPPRDTRYFSKRSQSRFVRQKTMHCSIFSASKSLTKSAGLASLTVSDAASRLGAASTAAASPRTWAGQPAQASRSPSRCTASVFTRVAASADCRASSTIVASVGSTGTTRCLTLSGRCDAPLRSTQVGSSQTRRARSRTASEWSVAEKKATWSRRSRAAAAAPRGNLSKIWRHVLTSSVSMKRSASSRTKKRHDASQSSVPRRTRSQTLRGVPVTTSTSPALSARSASRVSTPPMRSAHRTGGSAT